MSITCATGTAMNPIEPGKVNELLGDPAVKIEKPLTVVKFPGGDVEIARCEDGRYWIHVAVRKEIDTKRHKPGKIVSARMDFAGRYGNDENKALRAVVEAGDLEHIAFLIEPQEDAA